MKKTELKQDVIFDTLKNRIIKLEYKPGDILNEVDISEELGVSRTPVRYVFKSLEQVGLLNIVPRYGVQVPQIDFIKMKSLFEVTRRLDPIAASMAIDNITESELQELFEIVERERNYDMKTNFKEAINDDERFHHIITTASRNEWMMDILSYLHYHSERLWHYCDIYFDTPEIFYDSLGRIANAIKAKDKEAVEIAARDHIDEFVDRIKTMLL